MSVTTIGRYELRCPLARSAMSTVYEGWDGLLGRKVAVKIIPVLDKSDPTTREALARFSRGAHAAGILTHPNIVAVYDYGETDDTAYLVMEFVDGPTLKTKLDTAKQMELEAVGPVIEDILAGLAYSHGRGVVHRDIKPANIMIAAGGQAKITDFGVARIEASGLTQRGTVIGTPAYMSPEQVRGEPADLRADLYATGVILYQMLTGQRPYQGSVVTIADEILNGAPPAPSQVAAGIPAELDHVVQRAMAKEREDRYPSALEFARALRAACHAAASDRPFRRVATPVSMLAVQPDLRLGMPHDSAGSTSIARADATPRSRGQDHGEAAIEERDPDDGRRGFGRHRAWALPVIAGLAGGLALGAVVLVRATPNPPPADPLPLVSASGGIGPLSAPASRPPPAAKSPDPQPVAPRRPDPSPVPEPAALAPAPEPPIVTIPPPAPPPSVRPAVLAALPPLPKPPPAPPRVRPAVPREPPPLLPAPVAAPQAAAPEVHAAVPAERAKVRIFYPANSNTGLLLTRDIAQKVMYSDFAYTDTRSSPNAPAVSEVRYFHPEDQGPATRLALLLGEIGPGFQVRDRSDHPGSQPPGVLEVWIGR